MRRRAAERTAFLGVALTIAGCSALFSLEDHQAALPDASTDGFTPPPGDGALPDAADAAADADADAHTPTCGLADAFDVVASIPELASATPSTRPTLTADERTLYFSRLVAGVATFDLYVATRPNVASSFGTPARVSVSATATDELAATPFRGSGLFYEVRPPTSDRNLWLSMVTLDGGDFAPGTQLPTAPEAGAINSTDDDGDPFVPTGAASLYFSSARPVDGGQNATRIFRAPLGPSGTPNGDPILVLDEPGFSMSRPVVTSDELGMLYARYTTNNDAIHVTTRTSTNVPFPPGNVILPQPTGRQAPGWLSLDRCRLYFQRDVGGIPQIFLASRAPR